MKLRRIETFAALAAAMLLTACVAKGPVMSATSAATAPAPIAPAKSVADSKLPTGYRRVVRNGVEYFCSREGVTGSRTETFERCLTEAQLTALREGGQDFLRRQQSRPGEQSQPSNGRSGASAISGN